MPRRFKRTVKLKKESRIDKTALIGVAPLRKIKDTAVTIGPGAQCMSGSVIYQGVRIGSGLIIAHHAIIREENTIGDNFRLWNNSVIDYGCRIGNNVKVHCNVYVAQFSIIEDDVFLAPGVVLANDPHPGCAHSKECLKGPLIRRGAQIGCNATVLPGVTIGEYAMVGAGSVVTRDVAARSVVCGNPAKAIKSTAQIVCERYPDKGYQRRTERS